MSLKILGRGKTKTIRTPCEIHGSFRMGCENFAHPANQFRIPNIVQNTVWKPKGSSNPFCTLCENQKALRKNQKTLCHIFLNPRALISPFRKHPYHCESLIFLYHLTISSLHNVKESHSEPSSSIDSRPTFHFRHGTDPRSPSCPFTESHSEAVSLLCSGASWFSILGHGGPADSTFWGWNAHKSFLSCSSAQIWDKETTYYTRGDYFAPWEFSAAPSCQEG